MNLGWTNFIRKQDCVLSVNNNFDPKSIYGARTRYITRQRGACNSIRSRREGAYCPALTYITPLTRLRRVVSYMTLG